MRRPFAKAAPAMPHSARQFFIMLLAIVYVFLGTVHHTFCLHGALKQAGVVEMTSSTIDAPSAKIKAASCDHCSHGVEHLSPPQGCEFAPVAQSERVEKAALALNAYHFGMDTPPPRIRV
jgi:hypothetical protein